MITPSLLMILVSAPVPPPKTFDQIVVFAFIAFAIYKGIRLVKTTRLGWSFAIYNFVLAFVFLCAVLILPVTGWPVWVDADILTVGRVALLLSIMWCVYEVEDSRAEMRKIFGNPRRGHGQQT